MRLCLTLPFTLVILACALPARAQFSHEVVDADGVLGTYCSLAVDRDGAPHISYYDAGAGNLKYAHKVGGAWHIERADRNRGTGTWNSIAVDTLGRACIAYYDAAHGWLKYARHTDSGWAVEVVDSGEAGAAGVSLALDAAQNPHIAYYAARTGLRYASRTASGWWRENLDTRGGGANGYLPSLALDALGRAHITYGCYEPRTQLAHAYQSDGAWKTEAVLPLGYASTLKIDADGLPRVAAFQSDRHKRLVYGVRSDTGWTGTIVDSMDFAQAGPGFAMGSAGQPMLAYHLTRFCSLIFNTPKGRQWTKLSADDSSQVGFYASMALDSRGNPMIAYGDTARHQLKLAWASLSAPSAVQLESPEAYGNRIQLRWTVAISSPTEFRVLRAKRADGPYTSVGGPFSWHAGKTSYEFTDNHVDPGVDYFYRLQYGMGASWSAVGPMHVTTPTGILGIRATPAELYPDQIEVRYEVGRPGLISVAIYSGRGVRVRKLFIANRPAGVGLVRWDGKDDAGNQMPPGDYTVRITADAQIRYTHVALREARK